MTSSSAGRPATRSTTPRYAVATARHATPPGSRRCRSSHLRHTFATLAIRGLDPATVQMLLGHSKITTSGELALVVVDASVLASVAAGHPNSPSSRLFAATLDGPIEIVACPQLSTELERALEKRGRDLAGEAVGVHSSSEGTRASWPEIPLWEDAVSS